MSADRISPPSRELISEQLGQDIVSRELISRSHISVVERVFTSQPERSLILKTVTPELQHESAVHEFAERFPICAAELVIADSSAEFPWLLQEDIGDSEGPAVLTREDVASLLAQLAEFHVAGFGTADRRSAVPDRTAGWLADNVEETASIVSEARRRCANGNSGVPERRAFSDGIKRLAESVGDLPSTVVHGDFDPGNLLHSRGRWRAIDWGLSHRNTPAVDIAHMITRFPKLEQLPLLQGYLNATADLGGDFARGLHPWEFLRLGNAAHEAFFVWWHSYCIVELEVSPETHANNLLLRFQRIQNFSN